MKRVLIVMESLAGGGAEKSLVNMLNEMPVGKYSIDLLLFKRNGMFLSQVPSTVNILDTPKAIKRLYAPLFKSGIYFPIKLFATGVSRIVKSNLVASRSFRWKHFYRHFIPKNKQKYDVAFAYISGEVVYYIGDKVNAEIVFDWVHNDYKTAGYPPEYDLPYFEKSNGIITISERCKKILLDVFPQLKEKISCIENITSSKIIKGRADEFEPQDMYGNMIILSVGRLMEQKSFDKAIRAAKIMKDKGISFKWYIIGDGELRASLEKLIEECELQDNFFLLGIKDNPYPYIKKCDIFVQTSIYEGKSVVIDEAKILAKPILTTNYPTVKDQFRSDSEGMIVEGTSEAIASGLIELIDNKQLRDSYKQYLLQHEYGNQDEINKYLELIEYGRIRKN